MSRSILLAARLLDQLDGVVQQRQRAQAEEVHLEQADLFQVAHDPLRRDDRLVACAAVVALADDALQRDVDRSSGPLAMTTPAACVPALRLVPSSLRAMSISSRTSGSLSYSCLQVGALLEAHRRA